MDGRCITDPTSAAYKIKQSARVEDGLYKVGDFVGVALSGYYGRVGDRFKITLSGGDVFYAIMMDTKKEPELDQAHAHPDGSIVEFVVDTNTLDQEARHAGSLDCIYEGSILKIERMK